MQGAGGGVRAATRDSSKDTRRRGGLSSDYLPMGCLSSQHPKERLLAHISVNKWLQHPIEAFPSPVVSKVYTLLNTPALPTHGTSGNDLSLGFVP